VVQATTAVPAGRSVRAGAAGEGYGVSGDLTGVEVAVAFPDQQATGAQPSEEVRFAGCLAGRFGHRGAEHRAYRVARKSRGSGEWVMGAAVSPAGPQLRQSEVCRQFPAAVPDGLAVLGDVIREADGVASHLAGVDCAVAVVDLHTGLGQAGEELVFRPCSRSGGAEPPGQSVTRGGSNQPRLAVCSDSARVGRRAAVRSAGAVARRPNWRSVS